MRGERPRRSGPDNRPTWRSIARGRTPEGAPVRSPRRAPRPVATSALKSMRTPRPPASCVRRNWRPRCDATTCLVRFARERGAIDHAAGGDPPAAHRAGVRLRARRPRRVRAPAGGRDARHNLRRAERGRAANADLSRAHRERARLAAHGGERGEQLHGSTTPTRLFLLYSVARFPGVSHQPKLAATSWRPEIDRGLMIEGGFAEGGSARGATTLGRPTRGHAPDPGLRSGNGRVDR